MQNLIRAHVLISGKVQGVFFRDSTKKRAEELGVFGWVRNTAVGGVEAIFEGEKDKVEKMVDWTRNGPAFAKVESIDVMVEDYKGEFNGFNIK